MDYISNGWLTIGTISLIMTGIVYFLPDIWSYEATIPDTRITFAFSDTYLHTRMDFNFISFTEPQILYIDYAVGPMTNNNNTIAIVIPYEGNFVNLSDGWIEKKTTEGETVIYKFIACDPNPYCPIHQELLKFELKNNIDSWRFPNHYVQIPFSRSISGESGYLINEINRGVPFTIAWDKTDSAELKITIDKQYDEWDSQPTARLSSIPNPKGGYNMILVWDLVGDQPIYVANYLSYVDRSYNEKIPAIIGIGIGIGVGTLLQGVNTSNNRKEQKMLKDFIQKMSSHQLVDSLNMNKNFEATIQVLNRILKKDNKDIFALIKLATAFTALGKQSQAIDIYKKILEIEPNNLYALNNLGLIYKENKDVSNALYYFERALEINPDLPETLNNLGNLYRENLLDYPMALKYYDQIINNSESLPDVLHKVYVNKARVLNAQNNFLESLDLCNKALRINPNQEGVLLEKGITLLNLKSYRNAIICFDEVLKINSQIEIALFYKSVALYNLHKRKEALETIEKYVIKYPHIVEAQQNYVTYLSNLGFRKEEIPTLLEFGNLARISGNNILAIDFLKKVIKIDKENRDAYELLQIVCNNMNDGESVALIQEILDLLDK